MNILALLRQRFRPALEQVLGEPVADPAQPPTRRVAELLDLVRVSQDAQFGDYQANLAMPLGKQLGRPPREVAEELVRHLDIEDLCQAPEIAGPGFINLRLHSGWLERQLLVALDDPRLGVANVPRPRTYVVDYSAPNVAKPMHVGHIRSTVIGDALCRLLRFVGHRVIGDNHLGDWGTQFGMIIYGFRHFVDAAAYAAEPVTELARLYRLVHRLVDYHESRERIPEAQRELAQREAALTAARTAAKSEPDAAQAKVRVKEVRRQEANLAEARQAVVDLEHKVASVDHDSQLAALAKEHARIGSDVLAETARLHAGDPENLRLWREFLPACLEDIERIYRRLGVRFDYTLGESFYHDRLGRLVDELRARGLAQISEGAVCIFTDADAPPMIIRKQDGAFLYATTDLATIQFRMADWKPDAMLYVVDHRQSLHFQQLFAAARRWGHTDVELVHVSFGTVLGEDGRPFKTRSGDTVGLAGLLDEAVRRAGEIVRTNAESRSTDNELTDDEQQQVAERVGIGALKYADLSQNRTSDYVFSYDKMLAMNGNTATYMQYAHARVRSIFAKGGVSAADVAAFARRLPLAAPAERALGLALLQFESALEQALADYRPHHLTGYLFDLANRFSTFFEECPVLKAETEADRQSRLLLCELTAHTLRQGLELLGIETVERM